MAKSDRKLHEARMAGAIWIMKLIEDKGIDEARKELATRRAMFVPLEISQQQLDETVYKIKMNTIDCVLIMSCMVLRDEFGFGQKRIKQFFDRFNLKTECLCDGNVIWDDFIEALKEETGIEFSIRENK
jgi:hypothetical protein